MHSLVILTEWYCVTFENNRMAFTYALFASYEKKAVARQQACRK
jgi:hypothetical protein